MTVLPYPISIFLLAGDGRRYRRPEVSRNPAPDLYPPHGLSVFKVMLVSSRDVPTGDSRSRNFRPEPPVAEMLQPRLCSSPSSG